MNSEGNSVYQENVWPKVQADSMSSESISSETKKRTFCFDEIEDESPVSQLKVKWRRCSSSTGGFSCRLPIIPEQTDEDSINTCSSKSSVEPKTTVGLNKENVPSMNEGKQQNRTEDPASLVSTSCSGGSSESNGERTQGKNSQGQCTGMNTQGHVYRSSESCAMLESNTSSELHKNSGSETKEEKARSSVIDSDHCVIYVHNQELIDLCNQLPRISGRAGMVHSLIEATGLLQFLSVVPPRQAAEEEVKKFHSTDYVEFLQRINKLEDEEKIDSEDAEQYGLTYDCPVQQGVYDCAALVAGATMTAADALCKGECRIAINWCGGWHHAQRSEASGFCYINDIVLGILRLRQKFCRVLYVDLDLHHGDGVENAFNTTSRVMTVSFHKYDVGFFPGSGKISDTGLRGGKHYAVNVPLKDGITDAQFLSVFKQVMKSVRECYDPEAVVCQCGADGLTGDPMASFNLTLEAYRHCLVFLMHWKLPLLLLGGGGYHFANTARCWASLTALTAGRKLPRDVPDHKYFPEYGPDYELTVEAGNRKNDNRACDLIKTCQIVTENLQKIKGLQP